MKSSKFNRRKFIRSASAATTAAAFFSIIPDRILGNNNGDNKESKNDLPLNYSEPRIQFSVIGINHAHIYSQVDAVTRGGGQLVSFHSKEDDLATAFSKKYPLAKRVNDEKEILEFIFTDLMLPNDDFVAYLEEYFVHWEDDCEMMNLLLLNFLQKPNTNNFRQFVSTEKLKFAKDLLISVIEKEDVCNEYIKSKLQNWDPERTAVIDMILMRMGICEFLYFETIPTKVTINEYIELAKDYSTPQSGHFVNGILDSIHKDLLAENKLHKISFKKS